MVYLNKLYKQKNDFTKQSLTRNVLLAIIGVNIANCVFVLPVYAEWYKNQSFFSDNFFGQFVCKIHVSFYTGLKIVFSRKIVHKSYFQLFAQTATGTTSAMLISLLCLSRFAFYVNKMRLENYENRASLEVTTRSSKGVLSKLKYRLLSHVRLGMNF